MRHRPSPPKRSIGGFFQQVPDALPAWATDLLDRFGLTNLGAMKERLSAALMKGSSFIAAQALDIGKGTADFIVSLFVMLYLLFFFVRDGDGSPGASRMRSRCPLTNSALSSANPPSSSAPCSRATSSWPPCKEHSVASSSCPGVMGRGDGPPVFAARDRRCRGLATGRHLFAGDGCLVAGRRPHGVTESER